MNFLFCKRRSARGVCAMLTALASFAALAADVPTGAPQATAVTATPAPAPTATVAEASAAAPSTPAPSQGDAPSSHGAAVAVPTVTAGAAALSAPATASPFGRQAIAADRLATQRGGASSVTRTTVDIGGDVRDNTATNVATGANVIRDGSFANSLGFSTVIQNSGANVLIQNSTTVNVQFR